MAFKSVFKLANKGQEIFEQCGRMLIVSWSCISQKQILCLCVSLASFKNDVKAFSEIFCLNTEKLFVDKIKIKHIRITT